jgi:hypothetical protein
MFSVASAAAVSGQRLGKHFPAETDTNTAIEERCFLCGPRRDVISKGQSKFLVESSVEFCAEVCEERT